MYINPTTSIFIILSRNIYKFIIKSTKSCFVQLSPRTTVFPNRKSSIARSLPFTFTASSLWIRFQKSIRSCNSVGLWIVVSCSSRRVALYRDASRGFIVRRARWTRLVHRARTRTWRPRRAGPPRRYTRARSPVGADLYAAHETEVPAAGEDRVNGLPFCGLRPRVFLVDRNASPGGPGIGHERREEKRKRRARCSNNRSFARENAPVKRAAYETEHRITAEEILGVPLTIEPRSPEKCATVTARQIQFSIALPVGTPWPDDGRKRTQSGSSRVGGDRGYRAWPVTGNGVT